MIVVVYGTRPEAIKLGPVVAELKALGIPYRVICTGQHDSLLAGTPAETDLADSTSLAIPSTGDIGAWLEAIDQPLKTALKACPEDPVVVVQGDTMSALAGAQAAHALKLRLAHVEAGIRSHNPREPFPEEAFRIEIDRLADWHYAPTSTAYANLIAEGILPQRIQVTGNTVVSALARYTEAMTAPTRLGERIVVTLHRREWLDGRHFQETCQALADTAQDRCMGIIWPIHPAVRGRLNGFAYKPWMELTAPFGYLEMISVLGQSRGVITDSGGLQEEAATLGIPCAVLRNVTDRPESIDAGVAKLFSPTGLGATEAVQALIEGKIRRSPGTHLYGYPDAANRIARHLGTLVGDFAPYYGD